MRSILFVFAFFCTISSSFSQTYAGAGGAIPDDGNSVDFTINVPVLPQNLDTSNFGIESVCINIIHTWDSDLDIKLIAPDGTTVTLVSGVGGGDDNFIATCFNTGATTSIVAGTAPFSGNYRPMGQLGNINNGQPATGAWRLHITDTYPFADQGAMLGWNITFGTNPAVPFSLQSSNLPIVKINTFGQTIPDSPKITAWMDVIDNGQGIRNYISDSANNYSGFIGIDLRGQSSQGFPQKQFGVETRDSSGANLNVPLLGMPDENDWVLYAPYNDKTMMRNYLTYSLARDMGRYASRGKFCEVVINGEYAGVYTFFERIKRDNNRVDISGLTAADTTGDELTGGYICSLDWIDQDGWYSNYPPDPTNPVNNTVFYQYIYPEDNVILPVQKTYIQQYVDSFETALLSNNFMQPDSGWRKFGDEGSFIDYFLMNELSKNVDGYRLSAFFYKNKDSNGGKLQMGPLWDFNLAWHNADYCDNESTGGWAYLLTDFCQWDFPFWWRRLMADSGYVNAVRCRYDELRLTVLDTTHIFQTIDSIAGLLDESKERQFFLYPILGVYVWPNPSPIATSYQGEIQNLKSWIQSRLGFMDANLPGNCISTQQQENTTVRKLKMFPDPATDYVFAEFSGDERHDLLHITITNNLGKQMSVPFSGNHGVLRFSIASLPPGVYYVRAYDTKEVLYTGKFITIKN